MKLIRQIGIGQSKYYDWKKRYGKENNHNAKENKRGWLLDWEKEAIVKYARKHLGEGYRRLTYMMLDEDVVAVSPSSVYRVLKRAGLLNKWNQVKVSSSMKGSGFIQPDAPHQHWHVDIKYVNFRGTFLFLISVIDGYSRYIVHHELRKNMQEYDVEITVQRAMEKYPGVKPRIITDNGSQFISKDFASYLKLVGLQHIRTSIKYPQSNGKIERFHRSISEEHLGRNSFVSIDDARKQIKNYIDYYNTKRLHSALYYLTPEDFLKGRVDELLKIRQEKLDKAREARFAQNISAA